MIENVYPSKLKGLYSFPESAKVSIQSFMFMLPKVNKNLQQHEGYFIRILGVLFDARHD